MSNRIGSQTNVLRWSAGETKEHVLKKLEICMDLKEWGHEFITEAIFQNGARADVFDLTEGVVYEILCSETEAELEAKIKKYPRELNIMRVNAKSEEQKSNSPPYASTRHCTGMRTRKAYICLKSHHLMSEKS